MDGKTGGPPDFDCKVHWIANLLNKAKLLLEATFFIIIFIYNGQGVLGSLVPFILDMGLAWLGSMVILDLYIYFR